MQDVAIIGAGELGGALAHALARRDVAAAIRLIDDAGRVAAGQGARHHAGRADRGIRDRRCRARPIWRRPAARRSSSSPIASAAREWQGEDGLLLLKRLIAHRAGSASILCAGASQRELVERGVRELHVARERLFGSAPEALAGGARALVALAIDGSPRDVALSVLGVPPSQIVIPWEDATIGGFALTRAHRRAGAAAARRADRRAVAAGSVRPRRGGGQSGRRDLRPVADGRQLLRRAG